MILGGVIVKRWKSSLRGMIVLAMLVSLFAAGMPVFAEETGEGAESLPVYIASEGFSGTQGANGWSYYGWNQNKSNGVYQSGGTYRPTSYYKYKEADAAYVQNNTSGGSAIGKIWANKILPGVNTGSRVAAVRAYTVSEKGVVTIDTNNQIIAEKQSATTVFQIKIRIRKNGTTIYPIDAAADEEDKWEAMNNRQTKSTFTPLENISVKQGDVITFEVIRATDTDASGTALTSTDMLDNAIYWDPVIRYTKVVPRKVIYSDNFATVNEEFWRTKTSDWTVEDGWLKNGGISSYIRFYAPHAVNYSVSFDLKFLSIGASSSNQSGFFITTRRSNDGSGSYYRVRLDVSAAANDIVYGLGAGDAFKSTDTSKPQRKKGTAAWGTNKLYHVTESVETDETGETALTVTVTDESGTTAASVTANYSGTDVCPAGGGGLSLIGDHRVAISNFVLEGEPSELKMDDTVKFFGTRSFRPLPPRITYPMGFMRRFGRSRDFPEIFQVRKRRAPSFLRLTKTERTESQF